MVCSDQVTIDRSCSVVFGYCAGAVGGQQQVFLKATGELFESTFNGKSEWNRWEATMFAVACIVLAVGQIQLLNKGLCLWSAIKYLPIYNVCLILCSTTYGGIFYQVQGTLRCLHAAEQPARSQCHDSVSQCHDQVCRVLIAHVICRNTRC
eukprot:TRINITY_DN547_c0_g1_i10.p3 TRINITY_DN547_c0_g1~~TRINITY_DN547_c0_g1_i10.p3  ORF type:complete len:151 (-),score=20.24 TRINITY_DN547_c0_g1_i10:341-793(-)